MLISCGGEYNAHAADTIPPAPAEALVLVMMIILAPMFVFSQILKLKSSSFEINGENERNTPAEEPRRMKITLLDINLALVGGTFLRVYLQPM